MATTLLLQQQRRRAQPSEQATQTMRRPRFDPETPAVFQTGAWQCSAASTAWVLQSLGYSHSQDDVVALLGPEHISPALGLHFGDGRALVALLQSNGLVADNAPVSFEDVLAKAGQRPLAIGGAAFYHWVGVRGREGDTLLLANPGPGWRGIQQRLTRTEFEALGPFVAVWVQEA
jgi:hypothetical protein